MMVLLIEGSESRAAQWVHSTRAEAPRMPAAIASTDFVSMALLGFLGVGHCIGMCGPLVLSFPGRMSGCGAASLVPRRTHRDLHDARCRARIARRRARARRRGGAAAGGAERLRRAVPPGLRARSNRPAAGAELPASAESCAVEGDSARRRRWPRKRARSACSRWACSTGCCHAGSPMRHSCARCRLAGRSKAARWCWPSAWARFRGSSSWAPSRRASSSRHRKMSDLLAGALMIGMAVDLAASDAPRPAVEVGVLPRGPQARTSPIRRRVRCDHQLRPCETG